jgi:hypothetical protein
MPVIDVHPHDEHTAVFVHVVPASSGCAFGAPESAALKEA